MSYSFDANLLLYASGEGPRVSPGPKRPQAGSRAGCSVEISQKGISIPSTCANLKT